MTEGDRSAFLGAPQNERSHPVMADLELKVDLVRRRRERESGPEPAQLGRSILGKADVLGRIDDGVLTKVPPSI